MTSKATRITKFSAENFKRLKAVEITPKGNVIQIRGRNAQGKSSVLDAIQAALGGKRRSPAKPVRDGEKLARVVTELDDGLVVTRTFSPDGGRDSLTIETAEGARLKSPQTILDALFGAAALDPLAFVRLDADERLERIRELAGVDVAPIEGKRARAYDTRTEVNRDARRLEGQLAGLGRVDGVPTELVDVGAVAAELERIRNVQVEITRHESREYGARETLGNAKKRIASLEAELEQMRRLVEEATRVAASHHDEARALAADLPDTVELRERLEKAEQINAGVRRNQERARVAAELSKAIDESKRLTGEIDRLDAEKHAAIAAAKLPIDGLSWSDDGVTLNGIPFEQASSAEQLRTSVALAIAAHPQLRVLLVREGSLLDAEGLELLAAIAAEHDCQVWLEVVSDEAGGGVVIEDGAVREETAAAPADGQLALGES